MNVVDPLTDREVHDARTLCNWASAAYGVPAPTKADFPVLNKKASVLFESSPGTDWQTLVKVIKWCHQNKRRYGRIWRYVDQYRYAWAAGAVDLPGNDSLSVQINEACAVEEDVIWRTRLRRAAGHHRAEVLDEWKKSRDLSTTQKV